MHDNKITNNENYEEIKLTITHGYMCFKYGFYALNKKIKNARCNGFRCTEILRLTKKLDSSLSHINKRFYLKV